MSVPTHSRVLILGGGTAGISVAAVAPELLQGTAETELRVVVGRRRRGERAELLRRLVIALAVEERAPERLADRGLVGLE